MEILLAVGVMAGCFVGLGLGLLLSKKVCLKGSCGGASATKNGLACPTCGEKDPVDCPDAEEKTPV